MSQSSWDFNRETLKCFNSSMNGKIVDSIFDRGIIRA